jgi:hypothetical protein
VEVDALQPGLWVMGGPAFHSIYEIERFLERKPEAFKDIVFELRNLVAEIVPQATEKILWGGLSYYNTTRGGAVKGGICQIEIHADHVRLSFLHGAFLPDPQGLLQGKRLAKRYVRLEAYESAPWEYLKELIRASSQFDPTSLSAEQHLKNLQGSLKGKGGLKTLVEERRKDEAEE